MANGALRKTEKKEGEEMKRPLTVGDLKKSLEGVPDKLEVQLSSDTGVDQGEGEIVIEMARRVQYGNTDYFEIYANDTCEDD